MPWVRLDESFAEHPKIAALSDTALALWISGLAYCNRNLTDGFIPANVAHGQLRYCNGNTVPSIRALETLGLWEQVPGGYTVHDYTDYQPLREKVLADREQAKNRMRRSREVPPNFKDPVPVTQEKSPNGLVGKSADVRAVYDHWRTARAKRDKRYDRMSPGRTAKIQARLKNYSVTELCQAITNVARDEWEGRAKQDDLTIILRSDEQVDKFLDLAVRDEPPTGYSNGSYALMPLAE